MKELRFPQQESTTVVAAEETGSRKKTLYQISFLRVIASLSVCMYHLASGNSNFLEKSNSVNNFFSNGYLGVQIFFIISGFVICYSLPPNYQLKDFNSFFKKRLLRVEPPYLISILFTLIVAYIASLISHNALPYSWKNLFYHLGYLSNFTTNVYINAVYWTLGIEFQFYIIIGLLFPFLNKSVYALVAIIITLLASSYIRINNTSLIFQHTSLFSIGILVYFIHYKNNYSKILLMCMLAIPLFIVALSSIKVLYVSLFTIGVILIPFPDYKIIRFLSNISFSLYLVHIPVGGRVINLSVRFVNSFGQKYFVIAVAFFISIITAYLFYTFIEKPAIRWSKKLSYPDAR